MLGNGQVSFLDKILFFGSFFGGTRSEEVVDAVVVVVGAFDGFAGQPGHHGVLVLGGAHLFAVEHFFEVVTVVVGEVTNALAFGVSLDFSGFFGL